MTSLFILCFPLLLLRLFDQAHKILELFDGVLGIAFVALIAIGGQLLEPGMDLLFRDIEPLGISLQAQVDAHLGVLFLTSGSLLTRLTRTLLLIGGDGLGYFRSWM